MSNLIKLSTVKVKPVMSTTMPEAKRRVMSLYKAWFRAIPTIMDKFDISVSEKDCRVKIREKFEMNRNVSDIRTIDLLVMKGQMELVETLRLFKTKSHVMAFFRDSVPEKPKDFLSKFLDGQ
ncbi:NADH dehydrogenase [ubiquinone] 1 alpha subcomplex subunit 6 isoform X2 [Galendromus occidentalis]|uniref:NADH dehydrogenase [ubiquinone] 1 alpha subcomplex subunit 6 n=1 Tax=Galendromus occidentalis TaxID=34638 RepID=A0AAJ7PAQ2_9ACAR|nr:NADH dehydrogenase [ubiquinone] 1 alpha subcomplex subunit 6 isoform X2 [Galendromus occidentalis]